MENKLQDTLCKVCSTMGLNLSGPVALCGFKPTISLSMPSAVMLISGILSWAGMRGWHQSRVNLVVTSRQGTLNL